MHLLYWRHLSISIAAINILICTLRLVFWSDILSFPVEIGISIWIVILLAPIKITRQDQRMFNLQRGVKFIPWLWLFIQIIDTIYVVVLLAVFGYGAELIIWLVYNAIMICGTYVLDKTFKLMFKLMNSLVIMQQTVKTSGISCNVDDSDV